MPQQHASDSLPTHISHNRTDYSPCSSRTHKSCSTTTALSRQDEWLLHRQGRFNLLSVRIFRHLCKHLVPIVLRKSAWWLLTISQSPVNNGGGEQETHVVVRDLMELGLRLTFVTLACVLEDVQQLVLITEMEKEWASRGVLSLHFCCLRVWKSRSSEVLAPGQQIHTGTNTHWRWKCYKYRTQIYTHRYWDISLFVFWSVHRCWWKKYAFLIFIRSS